LFAVCNKDARYSRRTHSPDGRAPNQDGIRSLVEKPFVILYRLSEDVAEIVAVLHGARDLPSMIAARADRKD
jgi:plasmid stabilization system protein ParE